MKISEDIKKFIEDNPVFIGSATKEGLPNITIIDGAKFLDNQRILIVDVQMTSCRDNLIANPSCCLSIYNQAMGIGYKTFGKANYLTEGEEFEMAQRNFKNQNLKAKGAIVVIVNNILKIQ